jgi:hypothetical protein
MLFDFNRNVSSSLMGHVPVNRMGLLQRSLLITKSIVFINFFWTDYFYRSGFRSGKSGIPFYHKA